VKILFLVLVLAGSLGLTAHGAVYGYAFDSGFANGGNIPDGNMTGFTDSRLLTTGAGDFSISSVTVRLNISGGFNGDLYGYLSYNGVLVPLVNRVGVGSGNASGYSDAGFNVTLSSALGNTDIHHYGASPTLNGSGQVIGTYAPDGRVISPTSGAASFDAAGSTGLGAFNGMNPNGTWDLVFFDTSGGGGTSHLISYELDITAVPETVNVALAGFGGLFALVGALRTQRFRRLLRHGKA
jgi:hypothetical protein